MNDKKLKELLQNPEVADIVLLAIDKEYTDALKLVEILMNNVDNNKDRDLLTIIFLQLLALAGYGEIASFLLEALLKNLKFYSKARKLCKRTIKSINIK